MTNPAALQVCKAVFLFCFFKKHSEGREEGEHRTGEWRVGTGEWGVRTGGRIEVEFETRVSQTLFVKLKSRFCWSWELGSRESGLGHSGLAGVTEGLILLREGLSTTSHTQTHTQLREEREGRSALKHKALCY
ncbi:hypothetical protein SARC_06884 [Sphaeroforma arctica JP610]|uniref:Uncharacterized protein n=1 Tax=Sphaeroforma arctica JP610 TaxID=667725 RepID=A0A0L0FV99_9EUKA|nr:hypothetical protein SARC_06884 [Sphaeroforma arctica JP610]KNC80757.1 hypothetical protein SARC_06884 [Sphaeroforma arctica JP610]|eukprot:XP_014154659.1 hypothetical protein SARC_06884 [Sphaeroforma arctica JP610]